MDLITDEPFFISECCNYFEIFGLKYYVRMTRFGKRQYDNPFDFADVLPSPEKIIKNMRIRLEWLYNYFIFKLK
jgi:hypothetical protein